MSWASSRQRYLIEYSQRLFFSRALLVAFLLRSRSASLGSVMTKVEWMGGLSWMGVSGTLVIWGASEA